MERGTVAGAPEAVARGPGALWQVLKEAAVEWDRDNVSRLSAALAYYTIFSLAPLLVIVIALAGLLLGEDAAEGRIVEQIQGVIGRDGAEVVQTMVERSARPGAGLVASAVGIVTLLLGATGVFGQLQSGLNTVWEVTSQPGRIVRGMLRTRVRSFSLILGVGFLLLVSLVVSAAAAAFGDAVARALPQLPVSLPVISSAVSFILTAALFAMIYKTLPDVEIEWRDVWLGAAVTSLLFTFGKHVMGLYLGSSSVGSTYGAAGTLAVLLLWIYYSAQIFYFGAEITQVNARRRGSPIRPARHALPVLQVGVSYESEERMRGDLEEAARRAARRLRRLERPTPRAGS